MLQVLHSMVLMFSFGVQEILWKLQEQKILQFLQMLQTGNRANDTFTHLNSQKQVMVVQTQLQATLFLFLSNLM